jgi:hypothetical protein
MDKIIEKALRGLLLPPLIELVISYVYFQPQGHCLCGSKLLPHLEEDERDDEMECFGLPDEYCFGMCEDDTDPWFCKDCRKLYQQCHSCKSWCFLVGHRGLKNDKEETEWQREKFREPVYLYCFEDVFNGRVGHSDDDKFWYTDTPRYNVSDIYLTYLDSEEWMPTGPSGGCEHVWNCLTCNETFRITDK